MLFLGAGLTLVISTQRNAKLQLQVVAAGGGANHQNSCLL